MSSSKAGPLPLFIALSSVPSKVPEHSKCSINVCGMNDPHHFALYILQICANDTVVYSVKCSRFLLWEVLYLVN